MQYLSTETENMAQFHVGMKLGNLTWAPNNATCHSVAKMLAQRNRMFQRTIAHVAYVSAAGKIVPLYHRINGTWNDAADYD